MNIALLLLSFLFAEISVSAQVNPQCPTISVDGPVGFPAPGEPYIYTVNVKPTESKLTYKWTLSHGTIAAGQGTPSIQVRIGSDETIPTVTVEVGGLPDECPRTGSEITSINPAPQPTKLDTFRLPLSSIGENRFKGIADDINNNPTSQLYILIPAGKAIRDALVSRFNGIDPTRITFVETNSENKIIEVWLIPPGATPPSECESCKKELVKPECPKLMVTGPAGITAPGETMTFSATVENSNGSSLKYKWIVTNGTIERGQGTSTLVVRFNPGERLPKAIATVEVIGLPAGCPFTASETYEFVVDPGPLELDEFSGPAEVSNKRLQTIANAANKEPTAQIYIFVPPDKAVRDSISSRLNKLITVQNEDGSRVTFVWNDRKNSRIEIWLIVPGVTPPASCRSCEADTEKKRKP